MQSIEITNVRAIERLSIPIPAEGGVVVMKGRNGAGKTTALDAAAALLDGEGSLAPRDGHERGAVSGLGCEITVRKQTRHAGTLEVQKIQGEDPGLLVDPGMTDPVAADRARIRALCRLAKVESTKALFAPLEEIAGEPLPITLGADVPESAAKTKRSIEAKAREIEEASQKASGRTQALLSAATAAQLDAPHDQVELAEAAENAVRELAAAEGQASTARQVLQAAQMAQAALDAAKASAPRISVADAQAKCTAAGEVIDAAARALRDAEEAGRAAGADLRAAMDYERAVAGWQASIDAAKDLGAPDEAALAALRNRMHAAREAQEQGALVRKALEQKAEADTAAEEARSLRAKAERLRHAASHCDTIVSDAIAEVAPRGLTIVGDRLMADHVERGRVTFAELSHGERWTIALDVAIDAVGEGGLLSIAQEAWEGLDAGHRQEIADHARRRQAVILTAEATMDDLHAEVLG